MTDEQLKAKKWDTLEEATKLKSRLSLLEREAREFSESLMKLGREITQGWKFVIEESELVMLNPHRQMEEIARVPWKHFDADAIKRLLADAEQARELLGKAKAELRSHGVDLSGDFSS